MSDRQLDPYDGYTFAGGGFHFAWTSWPGIEPEPWEEREAWEALDREHHSLVLQLQMARDLPPSPTLDELLAAGTIRDLQRIDESWWMLLDSYSLRLWRDYADAVGDFGVATLIKRMGDEGLVLIPAALELTATEGGLLVTHLPESGNEVTAAVPYGVLVDDFMEAVAEVATNGAFDPKDARAELNKAHRIVERLGLEHEAALARADGRQAWVDQADAVAGEYPVAAVATDLTDRQDSFAKLSQLEATSDSVKWTVRTVDGLEESGFFAYPVMLDDLKSAVQLVTDAEKPRIETYEYIVCWRRANGIGSRELDRLVSWLIFRERVWDTSADAVVLVDRASRVEPMPVRVHPTRVDNAPGNQPYIPELGDRTVLVVQSDDWCRLWLRDGAGVYQDQLPANVASGPTPGSERIQLWWKGSETNASAMIAVVGGRL